MTQLAAIIDSGNTLPGLLKITSHLLRIRSSIKVLNPLFLYAFRHFSVLASLRVKTFSA